MIRHEAVFCGACFDNDRDTYYTWEEYHDIFEHGLEEPRCHHDSAHLYQDSRLVVRK